MPPSLFLIRLVLLLTGAIALRGSVAAQTSEGADTATNSAPREILPIASAPAVSDDNSLEILRHKAEAGDAKSQFELGRMYMRGKAVSKDPDLAVKWYREGAEQGDANSQCALGACYDMGMGVPKDEVQAVQWYRKAADQGLAAAEAQLGFCYLQGDGVEKNPDAAANWFAKAAAQGDQSAQSTLGIIYYNLGDRYYNGTGVRQDLVEAAKWYRKAADLGDAVAQTNLGFCYGTGAGVKKDVVEAAKWYRKAADQGFALGEYNLGNDYDQGTGVVKDEAEAVKWYRKAADLGYAAAQHNLGICYDHGAGVEKDPVEAVKWYRKAAEQGDNDSQLLLGCAYTQGLGVMVSDVEGLAWIYVSSAGGNETAANFAASQEKHLDDSTISAARQRATELQAQITSRGMPANDGSTAGVSPSSPAPKMPKASGSGAFISADGLVLTAAHVVQGASRIEVVTASGKLAATVVKIDATNDVAILKCTGNSFTPLPIAPSKEARAGTSVFTIGFPNIQVQGFDPKLTSGEISSQTGFQDDPRQWQISVPIQPGNSGGPLCDESGNLIGIVEATLNPLAMAKLAGEIPQNVNYAVKSSYILPLLDDVQNLPAPAISSSGTKFEDVVGKVQKSTVLILVF